MTRPTVLLAALLLCANPAFAQIEECSAYKALIDDVVNQANPRAVEMLLDITVAPRCFALFLGGFNDGFSAFVRKLESNRADKQAGSSASSTASTSVVAQGPVAKVLSVAADYGALTQTTKGQVVTIRGNLAGLPSALVKKNVFPYCVDPNAQRGFCVDGSALSLLRRVAFGVSFDTARTTTVTASATPAATPPTATGPLAFEASSRELSQWSVHVDLVNRRDASSAEFAKEWQKKVATAMDVPATALLKAGAFAQAVIGLPVHDQWFRDSVAAVRAAGTDRKRVIAAFRASLNEIAAAAREIKGFDDMVAEALAAYNRFFLAQDELIESIASKNVLALDYTNNRPALQPATSNVRVILDLPIGAKESKGKSRLVINAAATLYHSVPADDPNIHRVRDAQFGVALDHSLGKAGILGPALATFAGYFQYQHSAAVLQVDPATPLTGISFVGLPAGAKSVFATPGNIWLAQAKLALVPSDSSVKIPLSVTVSNRTELIDKPAWRGQIGISYDLDSLLGALSRE